MIAHGEDSWKWVWRALSMDTYKLPWNIQLGGGEILCYHSMHETECLPDTGAVNGPLKCYYHDENCIFPIYAIIIFNQTGQVYMYDVITCH